MALESRIMSEQAEKLLSEALKLPAPERARLATELFASVAGEPDADADDAWAAEIDRRVRRVRAEGPRGDDWQTVHARIAARLRSRRADESVSSPRPRQS